MPGKTPRPGRYAPQIRAALAYADAKEGEVARHFNIHPSTLGRWKGSTPVAEPEPEQLKELADYCNVPLAFFERGFEAFNGHQAEEADIKDRLSDLEAVVRAARAERRDMERRQVELYQEIEARLLRRVSEALGRNLPPRSEEGRSPGVGG